MFTAKTALLLKKFSDEPQDLVYNMNDFNRKLTNILNNMKTEYLKKLFFSTS